MKLFISFPSRIIVFLTESAVTEFILLNKSTHLKKCGYGARVLNIQKS